MDRDKPSLSDTPIVRGRHPELAHVIDRNIATILELRRQEEESRGWQDRLADAITSWSGSMAFLYAHIAWFAVWIVTNLRFFGLPAFDPFPFGLLTMIVSLEAIFLSTFVLITQNRQSEVADRRADLDLQINLLAEHEITRVLKLVDAIADHLGLEEGRDGEVDELKNDVSPDVVLDELDELRKEIRPPDRDRRPDGGLSP